MVKMYGQRFTLSTLINVIFACLFLPPGLGWNFIAIIIQLFGRFLLLKETVSEMRGKRQPKAICVDNDDYPLSTQVQSSVQNSANENKGGRPHFAQLASFSRRNLSECVHLQGLDNAERFLVTNRFNGVVHYFPNGRIKSGQGISPMAVKISPFGYNFGCWLMVLLSWLGECYGLFTCAAASIGEN